VKKYKESRGKRKNTRKNGENISTPLSLKRFPPPTMVRKLTTKEMKDNIIWLLSNYYHFNIVYNFNAQKLLGYENISKVS
jgi:hypothetical protein